MPSLVRWPGVTVPGSVCGETICLTDVLATLAELTGQDLGPDAGEDSFSLLPLLQGRPEAFVRAPVVHHSINGRFAIRSGAWKLVLGNGSGGREAPRGKPFTRPYTLFDLARDPGESENLAGAEPARVRALEQQAEHIRLSGRSRPAPPE